MSDADNECEQPLRKYIQWGLEEAQSAEAARAEGRFLDAEAACRQASQHFETATHWAFANNILQRRMETTITDDKKEEAM